nr:hypothetical protein [uncultured Duganella sp.]
MHWFCSLKIARKLNRLIAAALASTVALGGLSAACHSRQLGLLGVAAALALALLLVARATRVIRRSPVDGIDGDWRLARPRGAIGHRAGIV